MLLIMFYKKRKEDMKFFTNIIASLALVMATATTTSSLFLLATTHSAGMSFLENPSAIKYSSYVLIYLIPILLYSVVAALASKFFFPKINLILSTIAAYVIVGEAIWRAVPEIYIYGSALIVGFIGIPIAARIKFPAKKEAKEAVVTEAQEA